MEELEVMSKKRIRYLLVGKDMTSSSGTDESSDDGNDESIDANNSASNDSNSSKYSLTIKF